MNVRVSVYDPVGNLMRVDVIPLNGLWTLTYYGKGPAGSAIVGRITLEPTELDADTGCWDFSPDGRSADMCQGDDVHAPQLCVLRDLRGNR